MIEALPTNPTQLTGLLVFAGAAMACARAALARGERRWWLLAAAASACVLEVAVGLRHRAHDLVDALLQAAGLYDARSQAQVALLVIAAVLIVGTLAACLRWRRADLPSRVAATACLASLWLFAIEAISLHALDALMYVPIGPILLIGWVWTALALVIAAAAVRATTVKRESVPAPRR